MGFKDKYERFKNRYEKRKKKASGFADKLEEGAEEASYWHGEIQSGFNKMGQGAGKGFDMAMGENPVQEMHQDIGATANPSMGQAPRRRSLPEPLTVEPHGEDWAIWDFYSAEGQVVEVKETKQSAVRKAYGLAQNWDASGVMTFGRDDELDHVKLVDDVIRSYAHEQDLDFERVEQDLKGSEDAWRDYLNL